MEKMRGGEKERRTGGEEPEKRRGEELEERIKGGRSKWLEEKGGRMVRDGD